MKILLRAAALIVAVTLSSLAQSSSNDLKAEFERLHNQWFTAFDKGDGATMDSMEVPNLVIVNADGKGTIWQKPGPRAAKQKATGASHTLTDAIVRQFGDTVILTGIVTSTRTGLPDRKMSTTVVWVHQSGKWLIASAQWSEVPSSQK
ncbi:MAG: nuclear transport factor 2 family protein [Terriglobia bacterium]|jgi:ketosteroid isomerase-like protein